MARKLWNQAVVGEERTLHHSKMVYGLGTGNRVLYPREIKCSSVVLQYSFSATQWLCRGGERSSQEELTRSISVHLPAVWAMWGVKYLSGV